MAGAIQSLRRLRRQAPPIVDSSPHRRLRGDGAGDEAISDALPAAGEHVAARCRLVACRRRVAVGRSGLV